jgi:hypothetical protein
VTCVVGIQLRLSLDGKGQRNVELDPETLLRVLPGNYLPYPESGKKTGIGWIQSFIAVAKD